MTTRGGCLPFAAIGLLVILALGFHFGSQAIQDNTEASTTTVAPQTTVLQAPAKVTANATKDLYDGAATLVKSDDFPAGSEVQVALCLSDATLTEGLSRVCNEKAIRTLPVDEKGHVEEWLDINRWFSAGGEEIDCASGKGYCSVSVQSVSNPELWGQVLLDFNAGDPRRALELPD